jgi:hypothetical protein
MVFFLFFFLFVSVLFGNPATNYREYLILSSLSMENRWLSHFCPPTNQRAYAVVSSPKKYLGVRILRLSLGGVQVLCAFLHCRFDMLSHSQARSNELMWNFGFLWRHRARHMCNHVDFFCTFFNIHSQGSSFSLQEAVDYRHRTIG